MCARFDKLTRDSSENNHIYFGFQNDLLQFALMGLQGKTKKNKTEI